MRIGFVLYWCVFAFHLCKADDVERTETRDGGRRHQWGPGARSGSFVSDSGVQASNEHILSLMQDQVLLEACNNEPACLQDRVGLEAITQLHRQLDDDANGNVDLSESDDFLREELQYDSGYEKRQRAFHHNDDMHISVKELWEAWLRSEVHNWTVEQTVEWLSQSVDLPQYKTIFLQHKVTGATLPRLAVNNMQYLSNVLGIKDPIHKQKLALKAMDVVLFGPPKEGSRWKDWLLVSLLLGALFGGWAALRAGRASRDQLKRMLRDMEQLRKAEMALDDMQKELEKARIEQESATTEKKNLEKRLREAGDTPLLNSTSSDLEVTQLKTEIERLRAELRRAEGELEDRCWAPPPGLQQWLQLTHEVENRSYLRKKHQAEMQLQVAREACEKLRKKRSSLVGAFVSTHGKSIDDVDRSIVEARTALNEVTQELQERMHRWKQIERMCGFNIINNNGLQYLESALYRNVNGRAPGSRVRMSSSQDDLSVGDDASVCGSVADNFCWREDSSGSEADAPHYPLDLRLAEARLQLEERLAAEARERRHNTSTAGDDKRADDIRLKAFNDVRRSPVVDERRRDNVHFVLGGDNVNWTGEDLSRASHSQPLLRASMRSVAGLGGGGSGAPLPPPRRPLPQGQIVRSRSTDIVRAIQDPTDPRPPPRNPFTKQRSVLAEDSHDAPTPSSITPPEEESTDSSLVEDEGAPKPRRRRLQLPFGKKSKTAA
ncbi:stromal interaction molecule homolog isoform X3 [Pectinophora gossypiella]|uniref:stromal interaction molecule homolog isoform X3 n=1 Tax=Pectinophora gossypiella TaxID=13191 RepID=UPI00214F1EFE|nr:stromal interaction molecule homolog isoform X3 [Pectinophora gossypiella]